MHYEVDGFTIRSENAARSMAQPSGVLIRWIASQQTANHALDYGCGKLRYSGALAQRCKNLTLVDSKVQLNRVQKLGDETTTVYEYAASHWPHARVLAVEEFEQDSQLYDLVLCANVLSAIPNVEIRSHVLSLLAEALKPGGTCLFVAQYRNSYFKEVAASPRAIPHLDGWLVTTPGRNAYFGILSKDKLESLASSHGHELVKSWVKEGSAYVLTRRECTV